MDARVNKTLKVMTPSDFEIEMTREFDAPRRFVFEAMTKPEYVARWLGCGKCADSSTRRLHSGKPFSVAGRST